MSTDALKCVLLTGTVTAGTGAGEAVQASVVVAYLSSLGPVGWFLLGAAAGVVLVVGVGRRMGR